MTSHDICCRLVVMVTLDISIPQRRCKPALNSALVRHRAHVRVIRTREAVRSVAAYVTAELATGTGHRGGS